MDRLTRACSFASGRPRWFFLAALAVAGCGTQAYESRLEETRRYFAYLEKVDASLGGKWQENGYEVRAPQQFTLVPAPVPTKNEDGTETPSPDTRQPDYINWTVPGLLAAWEATTTVDIEGAVEQRKAHLYVASNYWMFASSEQIEKAPEFSTSLIAELGQILSIPEEQRTTQTEQYPRGAGYVPKKSFTVANFRPQQLIDGVPYLFDVFLTQSGDVQTAIIVVIPADAQETSRINERIPLMLENMKVSSQKPAVGQKTGQPAKSAPVGF